MINARLPGGPCLTMAPGSRAAGTRIAILMHDYQLHKAALYRYLIRFHVYA
jgi:hypothetical protein